MEILEILKAKNDTQMYYKFEEKMQQGLTNQYKNHTKKSQKNYENVMIFCLQRIFFAI